MISVALNRVLDLASRTFFVAAVSTGFSVLLASNARAALTYSIYYSGAQAPGSAEDLSHPNSYTAGDSDHAYGSTNPYYSGEFVITTPGGATPISVPPIFYAFKSFCLERDEDFTPGFIYTQYNVGKVAYEGGTNVPDFPDDFIPPTFPGGDPISKGTALLYSLYTTDALSLAPLTGPNGNFEYSNNAWAQALQTVIWTLEGEGNLGGSDPWSPSLVTVAGSREKALYDYAVSVWGATVTDPDTTSNVGVLNIFGPVAGQSGLVLAQSFLMTLDPNIPTNPVPEPGTVLIWSLAICGHFVRRSIFA